MPDFTTHHIFGQQMLRQMPAKLKTVAESEQGAFCWGLQGPDLLFFHRAVFDGSPLPEIGRRMHAEKTAGLFNALLSDLIDHRKCVDLPIIEAYCLGFICHYTLDREVHPYVFYRQKEIEPPVPKDNSVHWKIEAAIDRELYQHLYGEDIRTFPLVNYYRVGKEVRNVIAALYHRAVKKVYGEDISIRDVGECFKDGVWVNRLLYDQSGMLKPMISIAQNILKKGDLLNGHMKTGPLDGDFLNLAKKPWRNLVRPQKEENASVPELMEIATAATNELQSLFYEAAHKGDRKGLDGYDFSRNFVDGKFR